MPPKESYELEFVHEAVHQQLSSALLISWPPMSHVSDIVDLVRRNWPSRHLLAILDRGLAIFATFQKIHVIPTSAYAGETVRSVKASALYLHLLSRQDVVFSLWALSVERGWADLML